MKLNNITKLLSAAWFGLLSLCASADDQTDFEKFTLDPNNYCFGQIKETNQEFLRRWTLLREIAPRSIIGEYLTNPISPSVTNIVMNTIGNYGIRKFIIDPSKNALKDGNVWLHEANAKHYGAVGVTIGWNSKGDFSDHRYTYFEGPFAHYPTYTAYKWGTCIPNIEVFRSLGYQLESGAFYTSDKTTKASNDVFMFASEIPIMYGSPSVQYNYYLPPGGAYHFWDVERGVMPRFISFAGYDNPDPARNNTNIAYHERSGDPIFRDVEPVDFKGFAEGGYELHLYLKKRMLKASEDFMAGKSVDEISAGVKADVAEFKKTLPPVPEGFLPPTKIFTKENFKETDLGEPDLRVVKHIKRSSGGMFDCLFSC